MTAPNRHVLITGASSGIGAACAKIFAKNGDNLIITARRLERLTALKQALEQEYGISVLPIKLDVCKQDHVHKTLSSVLTSIPKIDVLINNAGLAAGLEHIVDADIEDWEKMIDTNVKGLLYVTKCILPHMLKQASGHIINIGSTAGFRSYAGGSVYSASKHAVNAITRALRLEVQDTPLRVTEVLPGKVETEFSMVRFKQDKNKADATYQGFDPLTPEDVADAIYYCTTRPQHVNVAELCLVATCQGQCD